MKKKEEIFDIKEMDKYVKKLKIPKEFKYTFNLEDIQYNDINMIISIRQDAGKTTQYLLLGLIMYKLYGYVTCYMRSDTSQISSGNISDLCDVIIKFKYLEKIFGENSWNDIIYKFQQRKFYLVKRDQDGEIIAQDKKEFLQAFSLENHKKYKSSYNNTNANFIIYDEIFDTQRSTSNQMIEFCDNISTLTRTRPEARVVMLGNNLNKYSFWFEEFAISKKVDNLTFGGYIEEKTFLGTSLKVRLLDVSEKKKNDVEKKKVRFFGFNTPKMAAFNGLQAFVTNQYQHIENDEILAPENLITNRIYIFHRGRYIQIGIYSSGQLFAYIHFSSKPKYNDNIILTEYPDPEDKMQIYGFGDYRDYNENERIKRKLKILRELRLENKFFYSTNEVGELLKDYLMSIK